MRKLFKKRKLFKGGNYMRKYGIWEQTIGKNLEKIPDLLHDLKQFLLRQNLVSLAEHGL